MSPQLPQANSGHERIMSAFDASLSAAGARFGTPLLDALVLP